MVSSLPITDAGEQVQGTSPHTILRWLSAVLKVSVRMSLGGYCVKPNSFVDRGGPHDLLKTEAMDGYSIPGARVLYSVSRHHHSG